MENIKPMTYTIQDCTPGTSWAARFRVTTWLDLDGNPTAPPQGLELGQTPDNARIGEYTSLGVISTRDLEHQLVRVQDTASTHEFVVDSTDIWDIDTVEWAN